MEIRDLIIQELDKMENTKKNWKRGFLTGVEANTELNETERKIVAFVHSYRDILEV